MKANSDTTPALYIGLDVDKEKTSVAIADPDPNGEMRFHGEVATTQVALDRGIRRIAKSHDIPLSRIYVYNVEILSHLPGVEASTVG